MKKLGLTSKALILAAVMLAVFVLLNFGYFLKQASFLFSTQKSGAPAQSQPQNAEKTQPNFLQIPSLGIAAPIVYVDQNSERVFQKALQDGVAHYPGTALPGQAGNPFIFGHSSDYVWAKGKYKTIFALLPKIEKGAEIFISDPQGNRFVYVVTESFVADPKDVHLLDQGEYRKKMLTLQTSYPIGTALKRFIVIAELPD